MFFFDCSKRVDILTFGLWAISSGFSEKKPMGLGSLKARRKRASNGPKIIEIDLQILAGDDFEKIFLRSIDEISLILLTFH